MTQVIFGWGGGVVAQACDRRVTLYEGAKSSVYDHNANKSFVFEGDDVCLLGAFTGPAYVGELSTDAYVAEALSMKPMERMATGCFGRVDVGNLNAAATRICNALNLARSRGARINGLCVGLAGWRWRRDGIMRPFMWTVAQHPSGFFQIFPRGLPRSWPWHRTCQVMAMPSRGDLLAADGRQVNFHPLKFPDQLSALILAESKRSPDVGPDVLAIQMFAATGKVHIRYGAGAPDTQYAPWIITRAGVQASAVIRGKTPPNILLGGLEIDFQVPAETGDDTGLLMSMERHMNEPPLRR